MNPYWLLLSISAGLVGVAVSATLLQQLGFPPVAAILLVYGGALGLLASMTRRARLSNDGVAYERRLQPRSECPIAG